MNDPTPIRPPTATPLGGVGNNIVAACPCGRIVAAPQMYPAKCHCGRRYQLAGDDEKRLDVWDADNTTKGAGPTYSVKVDPEVLQPTGKK